LDPESEPIPYPELVPDPEPEALFSSNDPRIWVLPEPIPDPEQAKDPEQVPDPEQFPDPEQVPDQEQVPDPEPNLGPLISSIALRSFFPY
jgi:molybdate transport system ATP-binding protein